MDKMAISSLTENVSAISAVFHGDGRYKAYYEKFKDAVGGFTGLWTYCQIAGEAFSIAEDVKTWDGEWIQAIDNMVDRMYAHEPMSKNFLVLMANRAINDAVDEYAAPWQTHDGYQVHERVPLG
jgi:hypothetical protein